MNLDRTPLVLEGDYEKQTRGRPVNRPETPASQVHRAYVHKSKRGFKTTARLKSGEHIPDWSKTRVPGDPHYSWRETPAGYRYRQSAAKARLSQTSDVNFGFQAVLAERGGGRARELYTHMSRMAREPQLRSSLGRSGSAPTRWAAEVTRDALKQGMAKKLLRTSFHPRPGARAPKVTESFIDAVLEGMRPDPEGERGFQRAQGRYRRGAQRDVATSARKVTREYGRIPQQTLDVSKLGRAAPALGRTARTAERRIASHLSKRGVKKQRVGPGAKVRSTKPHGSEDPEQFLGSFTRRMAAHAAARGQKKQRVGTGG